jgi:hypothetical protein
MLRSYLRLALFAFGLLVGIQLPGFVEDYAQRVDAHRNESRLSLEHFQNTARQFFHGDLDALVAHYSASDDPVFRSDASSIGALIERSRLLEREWQIMQGPWYLRTGHVVFDADRDLLRETWGGYRFQVLLVPEAIAWGISCALLLAWLVESLLLGFGWLLLPGARQSLPRHQR